MKKTIIFVSAIVFFLVVLNFASACYSPDAGFRLNIRDLDIDYNALSQLCTEQTCTIEANSITIKSFYNPEVALIIQKETRRIDSFGFMIKLPYANNESCKKAECPIISTINPGEYNWQESVKTDITKLKELKIIDISDSKITKISNLADSGKNVMKCGFSWKQLGFNEFCVRGFWGWLFGWARLATFKSQANYEALDSKSPCSPITAILPNRVLE